MSTSWKLIIVGLGALFASCAGQATGSSQSPDAAHPEAEAAMVALRRENDALIRENELLRDKQLMCAGPKVQAAPTKAAVRLLPEHPVMSPASGTRGVSLQDLPHSAPDAAVMERYAASAASSDEDTSAEMDTKRYRIVGVQQSVPSKPVAHREQRPGVKVLYRKARRLYLDGQRVRARLLFKEIEEHHSRSDLADNAIYWQAEDDRESGHLDRAQAGFMRILSDYPAGNKVEDAMFMLGLCFKDRSQFQEARDMLGKVVSLGRKELAVKARHELALIGKLESSADSMNGR